MAKATFSPRTIFNRLRSLLTKGRATTEVSATPQNNVNTILTTSSNRSADFNPVLLQVGKVQNFLTTGATLFGDLVLSEGGIRLQCRVEGSVVQTSESLLIIDKGAMIFGTIRAKYLMVLGEVTGDLHAERIVLGASAKVIGDITYERSFGAVTGARVRGQITETEAKLFHTATPALESEDAGSNKVLSFPSLDRMDDKPVAPVERQYAIG